MRRRSGNKFKICTDCKFCSRCEAAYKYGLTPVELNVVRELCKGQSNGEMADELGISEQSVKNHLHRIFDKMGVDHRTSLAMMAIRLGWAEA
jgi:DNA-binding CsgD family transcriptional regulator